MDRTRGMLRLRHLAETQEAKAEEMAATASRFHRLAQEDQAPRAVSARQLFQTPAHIADRMIAAAMDGGRDLGGVLEPSAGLGRIYQAIRRADPDCYVSMVEIDGDLCAELWRLIDSDTRAALICRDFFTTDARHHGEGYDSIVMNPPFKQGEDIRHIRHAQGLLKPGGRLVTLCYDGAAQNKILRPAADKWERLPARSFASEGTGAGVALAVFGQSEWGEFQL